MVDADLKKNLPGGGSGWWGNVSGSGPKCNKVSDEFWKYWNRYTGPNKDRKGWETFECLEVAAAFDSGILPMDLAAHISVGVFHKGDPKGARPLFVVDYWLKGNCELIDPKDLSRNPRRFN